MAASSCRALVVDQEAAGPVVDRARDASRAHGVEGVHGGHEPEAGRRHHPAESGHVQLGLAHHRDEDVERLLRDAVDLLHVEQRAVVQGRHQRPVDEHVGRVARRS